MSKAESLFQQIYDRSPTDEDRRRLLAAQKAMGLSDADELWAVIIALDFYSQRTAESAASISRSVVQTKADMSAHIARLIDAMRVETDSAKQKAELATATEITKQSHETIQRLAEDLFLQGQKASIRKSVLRYLGGLALILATVTGVIYYGLSEHFAAKEQTLIAFYSERLAQLGLNRDTTDFAKRFPDVLQMPELAEFANHLLLYPNHARALLSLRTIDPYLRLPENQRENIRKIILEAPQWNTLRQENRAQWPCIRWLTSGEFRIGNKSAVICEVGYNQ